MKSACEPLELTTDNGALPIRCFTGEQLAPDEAARRQLAELSALPGLDEHVTVLPDVHFKHRNPSPTGTVVVSQSRLVPRAIDPGINCGMRMVSTSVPARELGSGLLDQLFTRLIADIPIEAREESLLTDDQCGLLLAEGLSTVADALDVPASELDRIENRGRMTPGVDPDAIRAVIASSAVRKGNPWLGTLGAGNHFLELQEIVEVLDEPAARALGLVAGDAVFMMHSDSRRLGKRALKPIFEEALKAAGNGHVPAPDSLWTIPADSDIGRKYVAALTAATHAGFANRAALTAILRRAVRAVLGDPSLTLPLIYDCSHESIQQEEHGGRALWVHRHGASHALPPSALAHDPVLAEIGQPVPIPGNMGSESYIAVARPGAASTFNSVAHGAGRVMEKVHAAEQFDPEQVERDLGTVGVRLYRYGTDNIAGQAPASFKNVRSVVEAMAAFDLIRPVVRLRPLAVLKG
jgi:tRNA-splicing ligase RtcB (3'-phosphate/5'-hydroxy nucleic acid ligase)